MVRAESSASASRNALKANVSGAPPDYELPWYAAQKKVREFRN